ncbi:ParB N-terminal domain-containing protein [Persicobacter diffluens]|uniref:ParB N-terminal domain-containing protein n=1 Tax=Persicobacter diffluens TaxID=981 RepID=UPI0030C69706
MQPLSEEQFQQLKENIEREGVRDPLTMWKEKGLLVDGHHRFKIIQELGLSWETVPVIYQSFDSIEDVKDWMILNQLGRRNLNSNELSYLRGKLYNREKGKRGGQEGNSNYSGRDECANLTHSSTAEKIANDFSVGERTIHRDSDYAKGVDIIGNEDPNLKADILSGKKKVSKAIVQKLGKKGKVDGRTSLNELIEISRGEAEETMKARKEEEKKDAKEEFIKNMTEIHDYKEFYVIREQILTLFKDHLDDIESAVPDETKYLLGITNRLHVLVEHHWDNVVSKEK